MMEGGGGINDAKWAAMQASLDPHGAAPGHPPNAAPAAAPSSGPASFQAQAPGPTTNTAAPDPNLNWLIDKYKSRFDTSNTQRAIDKSTSGIADAAALMSKDAQGGLAARGALGSGVAGAFVQKHITDQAQRQAAGAASDIAQNEQTRLDNLASGGLGIMKAPADLALQQQANANQQYQTQAQIQIAQEQAAAQRAQIQWAQYQALMSSI